MKRLENALDRALVRARFATPRYAIVTIEEMISAASEGSERTVHNREVLRANLAPRPEYLSEESGIGLNLRTQDVEEITDCLRDMLGQYWDEKEDLIGHGFPIAAEEGETNIFSSSAPSGAVLCTSGTRTLAVATLRAAGFLGAERTAKLVSELADGKPIEGKMMIILENTKIDEPVEIHKGVRLYRLPTSSRFLNNGMPDAHSGHQMASILGETVLETRTRTSPAFFHPDLRNDPSHSLETKFDTELTYSFDAVLQALSLTSNRLMQASWVWSEKETDLFDYPKHSSAWWTVSRSALREMLPIKPPELELCEVSIGGADQREPDYTFPVPNLSAADACRAWGIRNAGHTTDTRMYIAIMQWLQAAREEPGEIVDRMGSLRTALEALYVESGSGELAFRMSLIGAHHLGKNGDERKRIQKTLNEFYAVSSRAVHGKMTILDIKPKHRETFEEAKRLCAEGIIKTLEEGKHPNWKDLLL